MAGYVTNIERDTIENEDYRRVVFTGPNTQLVLMMLRPGEEIGLEAHGGHDQFIRVEKGTGYVELDGKRHELEDGSALRGTDFFDAEKFPRITFRSARIEGNPPKQEGDRFRVAGELVIRDTTMEVVLDCEYEGRGTDPWGKTRAGFHFNTELDRREWGLKWNQALETGGVLVANKVRVEGEVQFVRQGE